VREYLEAVDAELEAVLYGNLLNVIAISIIAVVAYTGYNVIAPELVEVPYPALAGALTGVASLIPVIGMKIVYLPLAAVTAVPAALGDEIRTRVRGRVPRPRRDRRRHDPPRHRAPALLQREDHSRRAAHARVHLRPGGVRVPRAVPRADRTLVLALTFADTALIRLLGGDPEEVGPEVPRGQRQLDEF